MPKGCLSMAVMCPGRRTPLASATQTRAPLRLRILSSIASESARPGAAMTTLGEARKQTKESAILAYEQNGRATHRQLLSRA